jgi:hypothetical protein
VLGKVECDHTNHVKTPRVGTTTAEMVDVAGRAMAVANITAVQAGLLYTLEQMASGTLSLAQIQNLKRLFLQDKADGLLPDEQLVRDLTAARDAGEVFCEFLYDSDPPPNTHVADAAAALAGANPGGNSTPTDPTRKLKAAGFVTAESHRKGKLFPELIYIDIAESSNSKGWPVLVIIGRDANGKLIQILTIYLWCKRREAFSWVLSVCLPTIYGVDWCRAVCIFMADRDPQQAAIIDDLIKTLYLNAFRKVCYFHLLLQEFVTMFGNSAFMADYLGVIRDWCYQLAYVYETVEQTEYAWNRLIRWITNHVPGPQAGFVVSQPNGRVQSCQQRLLDFFNDAPYLERERWWKCYSKAYDVSI